MASSASSVSSFHTLPPTNGSNRPALSLLSSNTKNKSAEKKGVLEASILSVYDLPYSEPPTNVTVMASGITVVSGPPLARHKDKNSFRFSSAPSKKKNTSSSNSSTATATSSNTSDLKLVAPLRDLYKSTLQIRVVYGANNNNNNSISASQQQPRTLVAEYEIRQLRIHESKWLILNLAPEGNTNNNATSGATSLTTVSNDNDDDVPPTIRLKLHLSGPYRPEIAALVAMGQSWFGLVDHMEAQSRQLAKRIPDSLNVLKYLSIPTVPVVTVLVVASPVVAGVLMVVMPFLLPVILLVLAGAVGVGASAALIYASTPHGREHVGGTLAPLKESLVSSRAGQTLLYDTGPRPTPVSVLRPILPKHIWAKLVLSLIVDLIGSSSYLLPVVGEILDIGWAPMQTILVMAMYDTVSPNLKFVSFTEEILPFTDIVPAATIGWAIEFGPGLLGNNPQVVKAANQLAQGMVPLSSSTTTTTTTPPPSSMRQ